MSIFKRIKPTKVVDNSETIVYDFERRAPFWSYRPAPYHEYVPFVTYKPFIDSYLEKLFQGEIDDGNGDVLDNLICGMARQADKDLDRQHADHGDIIKSFDIRNRGDRKAFEHELVLLRTEQVEIEQQQAEVKTRLRQDKFIGGKKNA